MFRKFRLLEGETTTTGEPAGGAPAAAPAAPAGGDPAASSATPTDGNASAAGTHDSAPAWLQSIADADLRQFVEAKGFKDVGEAVKAMREFETKHAAPATAEEYQLGDGDFAKTAATWFHEAGIPAEAAKALAAKWNGYVSEQNTTAEAARLAKGEAELTTLKGEWGADYDKNVELGRQAMRKFGVSGEVIDKLAGAAGDAATIKVFSQIGASLSEGTLNPGGDGGGSGAALTQEQRAAKFYANTKT
ncbi:putative gp07 [Burkholderia pseudomallei MSHR3951]|nr:putative gp07 [Burkholderia pseudomallei MSHR3951]